MKDKLLKIREAIALLNSMILSGESHSETSKREVKESIQEIDDLLKEVEK